MAPTDPHTFRVYVGTYTNGDSKGIYAYLYDGSTGSWQLQSITPDQQKPAFLALHPNRRFLYAVNEVLDFEGRQSGAVSAFAIDEATGDLRRLNQQGSMGPGPCHLSVDPSGRYVLVANYSGGSVALLPISEDGSLQETTCFIQHEGRGTDPRRQTAPHAHSIICDPQGRFALAADLGLDRILVYELDLGRGKLVAHIPPGVALQPGAGPRHTDFHTNGQFLYAINELNSTITVFAYDAQEGQLTSLQTVSTLPVGFSGTNYCADIHIHPSGLYLYGSNRGHDSIVSYHVDPATGLLGTMAHYSTHGRWPRSFAVDPSGAFLIAANQNSDSLVAFRIDEQTGALQLHSELTGVPGPACVKIP